MSNTQTATCQDCGWTGLVEETNEFRNVLDRVLPGHVMPAGECPEEGCGGAAMLDRDESHDALRPALVALMLGLDRLRQAFPAAALPGPVAANLRELAHYARAALATGDVVQPVCDACGRTDVRIDAWAAWDLPAQRWELHSTYDAHAMCGDCGTDCTYTMEPAGERT